MKEMIINTKVVVCSLDELSPVDKEVVDAARAATANSYAVYSRFNVGAAVRLADGTIVCGTNQENAASGGYSLMNTCPGVKFLVSSI